MSKYFIEDTTLTGIADAIRLKRDIVTEITPEDMALQVSLIDGGGILPLGLEYYDTPIDTVFTYDTAPTQTDANVITYTFDGIPDVSSGAAKEYDSFIQIGYVKWLGEDWSQNHFLESVHVSGIAFTYGQKFFGIPGAVNNTSFSFRTNWGRYCTAQGNTNGLIIDKVDNVSTNKMKLRYAHYNYEKCLAGDYAVKLVRYKFDPSKIIGLL